MWKKALFVGCLILVLAVASPLPAADKAGETPINVMVLSGTTGLSLAKLLEEQPAIAPGVTFNYTVIKSPDQMSAKIIAGEADIAAVPTNQAAILYNRGIPVQLAAITNWGVMYIVGHDTTIATWADLKGKAIGITGKGSTPDLLFRYFLEANGIDPERDVQIQYYASPAELTQLVIAGKVRLATLPEPWITEALARNADLSVLLDYQKEWVRLEKRDVSYPQSALVVSSRLAKEKPAVVRAFLKAAADSSAWVVNNPSAAGRLAEKHLFISAVAATEAIPRCNLRFDEASQVQAEIEYFLVKLHSFEPQSIGGKLPDEGFYWQK
ncbi:MAG: ABC transporter substrate-binding protein [Firmicutes bacterium]|nr:ABC transporter substrate-binding protein [Bacillota bacterium]